MPLRPRPARLLARCAPLRRTLAVSLAVVTALGGGSGCNRTKSARDDSRLGGSPGSARPSTEDSRQPPDPSSAREARFDLLADPSQLTLLHQGMLIDLGEPASGGDAHTQVESVIREGEAFARIRSRRWAIPFVAMRPSSTTDGVVVSARIRAGSARGAVVSLDGRAIGKWTLPREGAAIVSVRTAVPLTAGPHELVVQFVGGGARQSDEVLAEVDWLHFGEQPPTPSFAAPTLRSAISNVAVQGEPKRAVVLRAPSTLLATAHLPKGARFQASIALLGSGEAETEIRFVRDRESPRSLARLTLAGGSGWRAVDIPLDIDADDGAVATLELAHTSPSPTVRVAVADLHVVQAPTALGAAAPETIAPTIEAALDTAAPRGVVVVVLGSIGARHFDHVPGVGAVPLPVLQDLRARSTEYLQHRASSGFAAGAVAALLTGQTAERHGVFDPDARIAAQVVHVGSAARDAGVIGAFFTGHPATARAFGFDRGWQHYVSHLPGDGSSFAAPFEDAAQFLSSLRGKKGARFVVVVHARGSHPPWDVTPEELRQLPPKNYGGAIDHRAAGAIGARSRRERGPRLSDDDRTRLWALFAHGLASHDAACGRLVAALRSAGLEASTTVIVTGDVAASEASPAPFAEGDPVDELALSVPLFIAWPPSTVAQGTAGGSPAGARPLKHVRLPTDGTDVATTVLATLGLAPPRDFLGADLRAVALGSQPWPRPLFVRGSQKDFLRWGPFVLVGAVAPHGTVSRDTKLCDTQLEPACLADVQSSYPIAFDAMRRKAASIVAARRAIAPVPRAPASVDHDTGVALRAWGR